MSRHPCIVLHGLMFLSQSVLSSMLSSAGLLKIQSPCMLSELPAALCQQQDPICRKHAKPQGLACDCPLLYNLYACSPAALQGCNAHMLAKNDPEWGSRQSARYQPFFYTTEKGFSKC